MKMINYNSKKSLLYNSTNNLALSIAVHPKSASDIKKVDEKLLELMHPSYMKVIPLGRHRGRQL